MDVPKDQFSTLLDHGLYSSAQILGCFAVSSTSINPETSPHLKAESLVLFGDSLFREREYRRAIQIYKQALQYHKILPKQSAATPPTTRSSLSASNRSSSPNSFNTSAINENEVKFKIATCHSSIGENRAALAEMEGISSKSRNLEMNLMMAKLYRNSRHTRAAVGCYKECLRISPYIIEAIIALAELGVSAKDILSLFPQTPNRSGRPPFDHFDSSRWLQIFLGTVIIILSLLATQRCLELFSELLQRFPNNTHILLEMAKVRSIDPYVVTYMDEYAMLLKLKSDHSKLNKLVHDLLNIDPTKPEVFVALSVLWEKKDERGALSYAEKSIRIDERHVAGYIMKAKKFYESALRLEPGFLGAALALAELHVMEGRNGDAVSLLERYLKDWADDSLHVKLAQVFAATNMLQDALSHYQAALRMNPQNESAKKGLERLEKQMKGVDPDAPEEDEDNEVDDGDGDQEEAELL
ncbi:UNVERIFIED_CONTAM: Anaphase-promoting complex subunit [Sesamum radiatum]|uniref:Anaphase-promoting complex subunit n=1 Tax=Sesamum radiatum TaxID=300843 RepID=A0AAW2SAL4_SESRA